MAHCFKMLSWCYWTKVLLGLCATRWPKHNILFEHFYQAIPHTVEELEIMNWIHPDHQSFDQIYTNEWNSGFKRDVAVLLNQLTIFEFIFGTACLHCLMKPVNLIIQRLQEQTTHVVQSYDKTESPITDIKFILENEDFSIIVPYTEWISINELMLHLYFLVEQNTDNIEKHASWELRGRLP